MTTLWLDLETYNATPIRNGTYRYAEDAEVLLVAWAIDDGPVRVDEGISEDFRNAFLEADELVAHNAQFDRVVLEARGLKRPIKHWRCTMAQAYAHSLPGSLDNLCQLYKVPQDQAKMKEGKELVRLFCMPRPKNMKLRRATKATHPAEWERFKKYAGNDIESMRYVRPRMPSWNYKGFELDLWHLDQTLNDRGIAVDVELALAAVAAAKAQQAHLSSETEEETDGEVESATKRQQLLEYILREHGVHLPDMRASTLERRVRDENLPDPVRRLLSLRLEAALTSSKKFNVLMNAKNRDDRLRGLLQYCGAGRTGRWSGKVFQPHNLVRTPKYLTGDAYEPAIDAIKAGVVTQLYESPMEVLSAVVRGALVAKLGHRLTVADLNAIEARVLAWLAGDDDVLEAFIAGKDIYKAAYAGAFGVAYEDVTDEQRQIGKVMILALGYQGAVGAVRAMAGEAGEQWSDDFIVNTMVKPWRKSRPGTVNLWYNVERTAKLAIANPGNTYTVADCPYLKVRRDGGWLRIGLPSGRSLSYPMPEVNDGKISYLGMNQYTRKWGRIDSYGGKLVENIVQAVSRDILAVGLMRAEKTGLNPVLSVHDEVICETPAWRETALYELQDCMTRPIPWAPGLPLKAAGFVTERYRK